MLCWPLRFKVLIKFVGANIPHILWYWQHWARHLLGFTSLRHTLFRNNCKQSVFNSYKIVWNIFRYFLMHNMISIYVRIILKFSKLNWVIFYKLYFLKWISDKYFITANSLHPTETTYMLLSSKFYECYLFFILYKNIARISR